MAELPAAYLRGIEQFNAGEFFACHETLEELWQQSAGEQRTFLHALIQAAAALHHYQRGNLKGARSLHQRAQQKLQSLPAVMLQLDTQTLAAALQDFFSQALEATEQQFPFPTICLNNDGKT
jgi:predicted metal-dependent hydrolase